MKKLSVATALAALVLSWPLHASASKSSDIDSYCEQLTQQLQEVSPFLFSGPDPWVQLDELPADLSDASLAIVYMEGSRVRWVELDMDSDGGQNKGWYETANYCFDAEGHVARRRRHFEQASANVAVDESSYYRDGKKWKDRLEHRALANGKEDLSQLFDPGAPEYLTSGDLPFAGALHRWRDRLAWAARPRVPNVLKLLSS